MDPMSIVEDTERTRFCPQTDRRTDGQTDGRTDGQGDTSKPPYQLRWSGGYKKQLIANSQKNQLDIIARCHYSSFHSHFQINTPDSKVHGANMGPIWVLLTPDGPHVGPMDLAIRDFTWMECVIYLWTSFAPSAALVNYVSIGSSNCLLPVRCQAITWTNAVLLSTGPLGL